MADEAVYDEPDIGFWKKAPTPLTRDGEVFVEGFLQKLGRIFKGWKRRWFVVSDGKLYYYKNQNCTRFGGEIRLDVCDSVSPSNASHLGAAFQIKSKSRSYTLAAATNEKREEWMKAIRKGILIAKHPNVPSEPPGDPSEFQVYATVQTKPGSLRKPASQPVIPEEASPYSVPGEIDKTGKAEPAKPAVAGPCQYAVVMKSSPGEKGASMIKDSKAADELKDFLKTLGETDFVSEDSVSVEEAESLFKELRDLVESVD